MSSKLDIWNLALSHIGDGSDVDDVDEESLEAEQCRKYYPIALGMLLERHAWNFAVKTVRLAEHTEVAPQDWTFRYAFPSDYVQALQVLPNFCNVNTTWLDEMAFLQYVADNAKHYDIESASDGTPTIVTNEYQACLRYIWRNEITGHYSAGFVMALSLLLSSFLAGGPILKSAKVSAQKLEMFELALGHATKNVSNASHNPARHLPMHLRKR